MKDTDKQPDSIHRFVFDDADIRGEVVTLTTSFQKATEHQHLPPVAKATLGEFLVAVSLVTEILKFKGTLTIQARGNGPIPMIMAESTHDRCIRGVVKVSDSKTLENTPSTSISKLIGNGVLSLTMDPLKGNRYQGIVALEGKSLADCLSAYFVQSEQLPTRLWIATNENTCAGLLLQALPPQQAQTPSDPEQWNTAEHLANTVTPEELLNLDHRQLLSRLFNEFSTRVFDPDTISFKCQCSRERCEKTLVAMSRDEAYKLVAELKTIELNCDICGAAYAFEHTDLDQIFEQTNKPLH